MKEPKYTWTLRILLLLLLASWMIHLSSCSTIKRVFSKHKVSTDSTSVTVRDSLVMRATDSTAYHKSDSLNKKKSKAEGERTIEIEMEDGHIISNTSTASDYTVFRPLITGRVKHITITEKGTFKTSEVTGKLVVDSTNKKTLDTYEKKGSDSVHVQKKEVVKNRQVSKKKVPFSIRISIFLVVALIVTYLLWRNRKKIPFYEKLKAIILKITTGI